MSEKIDIKSVILCVANTKDGKINSVTANEDEDGILGVYSTDGEFVPIILKTDSHGHIYIGGNTKRAVKANPPT